MGVSKRPIPATHARPEHGFDPIALVVNLHPPPKRPSRPFKDGDQVSSFHPCETFLKSFAYSGHCCGREFHPQEKALPYQSID
jgi:hypothetical protein